MFYLVVVCANVDRTSNVKPKLLALKQIIGGMLITCFGMLSEAFVGHHGLVSKFFSRFKSISVYQKFGFLEIHSVFV